MRAQLDTVDLQVLRAIHDAGESAPVAHVIRLLPGFSLNAGQPPSRFRRIRTKLADLGMVHHHRTSGMNLWKVTELGRFILQLTGTNWTFIEQTGPDRRGKIVTITTFGTLLVLAINWKFEFGAVCDNAGGLEFDLIGAEFTELDGQSIRIRTATGLTVTVGLAGSDLARRVESLYSA